MFNPFRKLFSLSSQRAINLPGASEADIRLFFDANPSVSYEAVLGYPPARHAIKIISGLLAKLSCNQYQKTSTGRVKETDSWAYWLINKEPNPTTVPIVFRQQLFAWYLVLGQAAAKITRNQFGEPIQLDLLDPNSWMIEKGKYSILTDGGWQEVSPADLLVLRDIGDVERGYSLLKIARKALNLSFNVQSYATKFFENGRVGSDIIEFSPLLKQEDLRNEFVKQYRKEYEGQQNAWKTLFVLPGTKITTSATDNENSQMLATSEAQIQVMASLFAIPSSFLGSKNNTSYGSLEADSDFLLQSVDPLLRQFEQQVNRKLLSEHDFRTGKRYLECNRAELVQISFETQKRIARDDWLSGKINFEEMRELDNRPTTTEGLWAMPENIRVMEGMSPREEPEPTEPQPTEEEPVDETAKELSRNILTQFKKRLAKNVESGKSELEPHLPVITAQLSAWSKASEWAEDFLIRLQTELDNVLPEQRAAVIERVNIEEELCKLTS